MEHTILTATYQIVTPMFVSDAETNQAELRIPSIKGAIRFWWRALNWDGLTSCQELYKKESAIFGSRDSKVGQSKILFTSSYQNNIIKKSNYKENYSGNDSVIYLAGQGVKNHTSYINSGIFELTLISKTDFDKTVIDAIKLWGLIGGLGQRSRKGFGSIAIQSIKKGDEEILNYNNLSENKYKQEIECLIENSIAYKKTDLPPYSAFSSVYKLHISSSSQNTALQSHINIATGYKKHRENRAFDKKSSERNVFGTASPRKASPVFLHIHPISNDNTTKYINVRLFLPALDIQNINLTLVNSFMNGNQQYTND